MLLLWVGSLPGIVAATLLVVRPDMDRLSMLVLLAMAIATSVVTPWLVLRAARRGVDSLATVLEAIRAGDYTLRARTRHTGDLTASIADEVNELRDALSMERVGELRAAALTRSIVDSVNVAIVVFDANQRLRLLNPAAEQLIGIPAVRALGQHADALAFKAILEHLPTHGPADDGLPASQLVRHSFGQRRGTWDVRHAMVGARDDRQIVLLLTDLTQALSTEQRSAWDRLIRVLSHEFNNSLASIQSLARSVARRSAQPRLAQADTETPVSIEALAEMIAHRATSLSTFLGAFAQQQQLPAPVIAPLDLGTLIEHTRHVLASDLVVVEAGRGTTLHGDTAQLEHALINVMRNGIEAATGRGNVYVTWRHTTVLQSRGPVDGVRILVVDDGHGVANTENLFVPFFSTKAGGSGVGLALARRIVEAHGGTLTLENRSDAPGARLELTLPLQPMG